MTWTGAYFGLNIGGGLGSHALNDVQAQNTCCANGSDAGNGTTSGVLGGAQAGYNFQSNMWLVGLEGDVAYADVKGHATLHPADYTADEDVKSDFLATVAARVGVVFHQDTLFYVKGGLAIGENRYNITHIYDYGTPIGGYPEVKQTRTGWMMGFGAEYALDRHWSTKVEYNYMDFGTATVNFPEGTPTSSGMPVGALVAQSVNSDVSPFTARVPYTVHVFKVGVNYRF